MCSGAGNDCSVPVGSASSGVCAAMGNNQHNPFTHVFGGMCWRAVLCLLSCVAGAHSSCLHQRVVVVLQDHAAAPRGAQLSSELTKGPQRQRARVCVVHDRTMSSPRTTADVRRQAIVNPHRARELDAREYHNVNPTQCLRMHFEAQTPRVQRHMRSFISHAEHGDLMPYGVTVDQLAMAIAVFNPPPWMVQVLSFRTALVCCCTCVQLPNITGAHWWRVSVCVYVCANHSRRNPQHVHPRRGRSRAHRQQQRRRCQA